MPGMLVDGQWVELLKPQEIKREDGRRGITFARINRDLVVIPLREGETWMLHPIAGIVILHPLHVPMWCHMQGGRYVRTPLELN